MRLKKFVFGFIIGLLAVGTAVFAGDTQPVADAANSIIGEVGTFITTNLLPAVGTVVVTLIGFFVRSLTKKADAGTQLAVQGLVTSVATTAVHAVEEHAANLIKSNLPKITGEEKFALAIKKVTDATGISPETAKDAVNAAISSIPSIGATGKVQDLLSKLGK